MHWPEPKGISLYIYIKRILLARACTVFHQTENGCNNYTVDNTNTNDRVYKIDIAYKIYNIYIILTYLQLLSLSQLLGSSRFEIRQPTNKFMKTEITFRYSNFLTIQKYFSFPIISRIDQIHNYKIYIHEKFILVRKNIIALLTLLQNFEMSLKKKTSS